MFFKRKKIQLASFGIIEAIIASFIIVLMVSGAVALSSASVRTSLLNDSYLQAEHIADSVMEQIVAAKSAGKLYFDSSSRTPAQLLSIFSIDCFATANRSLPGCKLSNGAFRPEVPYVGMVTTDFSDDYVKVKSKDVSPAFPDGYFSWKLDIKKPDVATGIGTRFCRSVAGINIPVDKCRFAEIEVKWTESSGIKQYYLTQYFTDWNNQ